MFGKKKELKMNGKKTWKLLQKQRQVPLLCVSKDRDCLAVKTWTAKALQFLRVAGHHYLP